MSNTNHSIFSGLKIVAWVIFIGLCIEAGSLILNFIFSMVNPDMVGDLYQKLDLRELREESEWAFFSMYSIILSIAVVKAHLFYIVTQMMQKIDLAKPFNRLVSKQISQISYYALAAGLLSYLGRQSARNFEHKGFELDAVSHFWADSQAFILMAAVIYVIAIIFSKGVDYQEELEETV